MGKTLSRLKSLYERYNKHEISASSAQLAYYFLLSFLPLLIFIVTVISYFPISIETYLNKLSAIIPGNVFEIIKEVIEGVIKKRNSSFLSFSIISTFWIASKGMNSIIKGLNKAYEVEESRKFWKVRAISILFTILVITIILFLFLLLIFGQIIIKFVGNKIEMQTNLYFVLYLRYIIMYSVMTFIFATLYKSLPNCKLTWKEVIPGATFSAIGWSFASLGFSYYTNNFRNFSKVYGSIGGGIVLLTWLFISGMVILIGGEINAIIKTERNRI